MSAEIDLSEEMKLPEEAKWYVVHTYSGYEAKVKANLEKIIQNRNMQDVIEQVAVPVQEGFEMKNGQKKPVERKLYPGYVLLKMVMNDDTWYVVRNTRGVTSFVGPGSKPVPLTDEEVISMGIELSEMKLDIELEETVKVISGPFEGSIGNVKEINPHKRMVKIRLSIFGRETFVELAYETIQRLS